MDYQVKESDNDKTEALKNEMRNTEDVDYQEDYQVLSPHLNLQDIHAFTESGFKSKVIKS